MKFIPTAVTLKVGRQLLITKKHSPVILFAGGVTGIVATTVMACRATLKLDEVLEKAGNDIYSAKTIEHKDYSESDRRQDLTYIYVQSAVKVAKLYGPSIVLGTISIAALTGSHNILSRRNAALTAAYAAVEKGFREYRDRVIEEYGEDKDREFKHGGKKIKIVEQTDKGEKTRTVTEIDPNNVSVYARFFDELCPSWSRTPEYNRLFLQCQQNYANDLLRSRGHVFLNEVYDMLGIERSQAGAVVGWRLSDKGDNFVDFGVLDGEKIRRDFVNGREGSILLDFNVDGLIYDKI